MSNGFIYVVNAHFIDKIEKKKKNPVPKCLCEQCVGRRRIRFERNFQSLTVCRIYIQLKATNICYTFGTTVELVFFFNLILALIITKKPKHGNSGDSGKAYTRTDPKILQEAYQKIGQKKASEVVENMCNVDEMNAPKSTRKLQDKTLREKNKTKAHRSAPKNNMADEVLEMLNAVHDDAFFSLLRHIESNTGTGLSQK